MQGRDPSEGILQRGFANSVSLAPLKPVFQPKAERANSPANSINDCLNPQPGAVRSSSFA
ncbi:hypothetical protein MESS4_50055 [Mesorhizobium sp. STM 4661]|nr:hypothetical protein MESS4_50055 [Mesorhizobium sp. STM 4661]